MSEYAIVNCGVAKTVSEVQVMKLATARVTKIIEWVFASPRVLGSSAILVDPIGPYEG